MADYHMLNDGVFGVGGNDIMEETGSMVNAVSYSHSGAVNTPGQGMMSQSMSGTPGQNPNVMMQGMVPMQQAQSGAQMPSGGMSSYHQGAALHGYSQNEVPQKLHQYSVYGSQLQSGNMTGQYVSSGPRLHHLSDPMSSIPDQSQQTTPRTVVPNQMYQNRNMASGHYGQVSHSNSAPTQMSQGAAQYPSHYGSVQHHGMQQHPVQQVNQSADMWQNSMPHSQMTRPCMPASQPYSQHQMVPNQHGANALNHSPMTIQGQRPSTPNQSQYMTNQDYPTPHAAPQQPSLQRPPVYNMNSNSVNQNGSIVGQINSASQPGLSQNLNSMSQTEQSMTFPQGHYGTSQTPTNRPHYNTGTAVGNAVGLASQHVMNQQMMNVRPPVHQMGYSPVPSRVNSGQQHASSVPPGSPARLQQYHPPFSPSQGYTATQPSPRPTNPESATPPHLHYSNSQPHVQAQAPMSPQYRSPFPSQVTHSPQHLTPTPPAEVSAPPRTPERVLQSSTPQSQGSYHSPTHLTNATHLTSPAQGHSPGNSNAPSSLQHLEQMVLPRASTGPSTTPTATNVSPNTNASISHNSGNYYSHLSSGQHHVHHTSTTDSRPQTQSPSFSHVSQALPHHTYLNQSHTAAQQSSSTVSNVPNTQPLQPNVPNISTLSNSSLLSDESTPIESNPLNSVSYSSDNSSSIPSVSASTEPSLARNVNVTTTVGPIPTSDTVNQMPCAPSTATDSILNPQYNMLGKTPYQGSSSSITFEMQQIQQELQQLYGMHQSPEIHEKIKTLQDRLHYLQAQPNPAEASSSHAISSSVTDTPMSPHYQQHQMLYNSGSNTPYAPMIQPMHYKPQTAPQPSTIVQEVVPTPQQSMNLNNMNNSIIDPMVQEQMAADSENMMHNHYTTAGQEVMAPILLPEKPEPVLDPYEMTFNDEPPPKMKKRAPKEPKPKKPKSPKIPKSPKPKKPKKGKGAVAEPLTQAEGFPPVGEPVISVETAEGVPLPVPGDPVPGMPEATESKPKKASRKRKPKEMDGEPKEPKPKKPRKKPEKKPKQPKGGAPLPENGENATVTEGASENIPLDTAVATDQTSPTEKSETEGQENPDAPPKEVKEKKAAKSKSPKTPKEGGTPKEPKKSTPKKKLPKIALKFTSKKKKKKALTLSDHSDVERTPPPSPTEADGITKRRSARNTERKKYTDDIELHLSDDETIEMDFGLSSRNDGKLVQVVVDNHTEDYMVVEKILAIRVVQKQVDNNNGSDADNSTPEVVDVEEYYVKYKNLSYIHCEWKTLEELEKGDRRFIQKVKRFKQKKETFNFFDFLEEDPFNPDYVEVDRVLDVNEVKEYASSEEPNEAKEQNDDIKSDEIKPEEIKPHENKTEVSSEDQNDVSMEVKKEEAESQNVQTDVQNVTSETTVIETESKEEAVKEDQLVEEKPKEETEGEPSETAEPAKLPEKEVTEANSASADTVKETESAVINEDENCKVTRHYLVKWRALTYEESTWELEDDVDRDKIEQFLRFKNPPPKEKWKNKKRPRPSEWSQLPESPVYKGSNTLREYQLEGVNWLTFCWYNSQNCILADEMGLGKTIQSITFLNEIDKYGIPGPFLVIAPLSTIGNWQREFETWTDLNAITYHGSSPSRNMILEYEMYWKDEKGERIQDVYKFQVMITTFEIILTDCMELKSIPWRCVIIDEAHRLKNRNCKLLEGLRMLNTEHRVLLTGTPLQNNVEELFSLLNFLEPTRFASTEAFLEEFGNLKTESQVDKLKALLKPMMLRRLKEDVEKSLAPKEETVVEVELTNIQKKYYRAILERNFTFLTKGNCYSNMPNLMNTMMELRKCCIHPFLINGAEEQIINDYKMQHEDVHESNLNAMVQASGKLVLMDKLLPRLRTDGHRVLVFSQMVRCLDILEDYLVQKRYPYERIDGRVRGNLRQAAIDRFCKPDSDRFVFLLCTRAGGLGINLTAADTVIIFDSDWNPQNDLQAQARCHRIGQSKAVKVYRLICRNTYEREMFDKASLKLGLDKAVLQSMSMKENVGMNQQMSKKEIEDLLRKGAYGALMEDDNAGDKFCEEDIDQILQRRTQVITLESGTKGSTFSKATFASASTRSDIEIDDPNFWEKWAKKAHLDVDELKNRNELIIQEPRRRTQTRRFGTDDIIDLSELDTSDEDDESISCRTRASRKGSKNGRKTSRGGRGERDDDFMEDLPPGNWTRAECYKMEKGLLTFGWGRWDECMALGQFRRRMTHKDCEEISRTILLYCLLHYKGDEKIKSFIWDLICPNYEGEERIHKNHSESETTVEQDVIYDGMFLDDKGLSAPVPRGRKGKKIKKETKTVDQIIEECEWTKEEVNNPDSLLNDEIYKRHLNRHSNKVLLRVRLLYYLRHEIIGDLHDQVFSGLNASEIPLFVPPADGEPPTPWWDQELDKSLLLGIYKHGFERYNLMRQDPTLCFLSRCGPPDGAALLAELNNVITNEDEMEDPSMQKDKDDEMDPLSPNSENEPPKHILPSNYMQHAFEMGMIHFPSVTDVNTRVRRLVTAFQRNNKKLEIRNAQKARKIERREKFEAAIRERELKKRELQQRKWSRREEADFYRTISSFGVEYNEEKKEYNWARFRGIARLERKYDETLAEYYKCFYAMCKRVCGRELTEEEEQLSMNVEPISEERASRCLQRVELLNKIREEILSHPELDERLKLCQPSMDLPDWWICGKHDKDLLIGAAKHGLSRMDYHLLHDPNLSFKDVLKNYPNAKTIQIGNMFTTPIGCSSPLNIYHTDENMLLKDESFRRLKEELPICSDEYNMKEDISFHKHLEHGSETKKEVDNCKEKMDIAPDDQVPKIEKEVIDEIDVKVESNTESPSKLVKKEDVTEKENIKENIGNEPKSSEIEPKSTEGEPNSTEVEPKSTEVEPKSTKVEPKSTEVEPESTEVESKSTEVEPKSTEVEPTSTEVEPKSTEVLKSETNASSEGEEEKSNLIGSSSENTQITKVDEKLELKNEDDLKVEDEETDIETDNRKEEEENKEAMPVLEKSSEVSVIARAKSPVLSTPVLEEIEKEELKYDCDTDTESKSHLELIQKEVENSMKHIKSEKNDIGMFQKSLLKVKQEEIMSEDNFRDKYNLQKMLHKDDPMHSQVDDSQGCISQNDEVMSQASFNLETEMGEPTVAQLLAFTNGNAVRWPKDKVLQIRLEHIVHAVEKNEWPIIRHTFLPTFPPSAPTPSSSSSTPMSHPPVIASPALSHRASPAPSISSQGHSGEVTPEHTPLREPILPSTTSIAAALQETIPPTPPEFSLLHKSALQQHNITNQQPLSESSKHRRRRRRRRFEIEAERAKLRQLLSHNMQQQQHHHQQQLQHVQQFLASSPIRNKIWEEHVEDGGKPAVPSLPPVPSPAPSASSNVPPPAHQNSSSRIPPTVGTLDLRVKSGITPPTPFTPVQPKGKPVMPVEPLAGSNTTEPPASPIDLSASSHSSSAPPSGVQPKANMGQPKSKSKKGGSRIDALALNLQARKQQQLMQDKEQHHPLADMGSMLERAHDGKHKEQIEQDECLQAPPSSRHSLHHQERRSLEEEEAKLRKKRLQYSEESVRKSLNRGFDMAPTPAHSSFLNPSMSGGSARLNLSGQAKSEDHSSGIGTGNNPLLDPSSLVHHDFKKWIDDHPELVAANPNLMAAAAAAMAFSPVSSFPSHTELLELPEGRKRGRRPRLDPTKLDYEKITGEENVSVINRLTGKKITGSKAPPLKYLAEWLDKNPMFDVDPKWGPLVREKGNLPNNMNKRIVTPSEKRGRRTAASLLASAHQNLVPPVTTMSFPSTTGLNPLNFANTGMLSGFPNMKFFMDPTKSSAATTTTSATSTSTTNPPIFLPFGGLAGMGLTNPLFGFPGFNFPGLQGSSPLGTPNLSSSSAKDHSKDDKTRSDKESSGASRKNTPATSTSSSLPSSSLPFLYPPGLLYNPLGLGSFTIPPNLPASFGSFTQSGLVNGLGLSSNPLFTTSSLGTTLSSPMATVTSPSVQSILTSSAMVPPVSKTHTSSAKLPTAQSHFNDGQETDDESLKSLMGNHDDDDDDLDDKMEVYDNPDKDDSDRETFRDVGRSPAAVVQTSSSKTTNSDSESVCLAKTSVENSSLENKTRGTHDDPTSDSTDTESKHS